MTKKEKEALALEASNSTGYKTIYVNSKGECFTSSNLAGLSDSKDNIDEFDFSKTTVASEEADAKKKADAEAKAAAKAEADAKKKAEAEAKAAAKAEADAKAKAAADAKTT